MKFSDKKILVLILIALALFSALPKTANAIFGIGDTGTTGAFYLLNPDLITSINATAASTAAIAGSTGATTVSTGAMTAQQYFEWAFKIAGEALKKQLLNMIVDQIVQWIQGGGDPKFITDWPGFFRDAVDQAGGKFLQKIGLSQLCSAFKDKLSRAFIPIPTFTERTSCTLSKIGVNLDMFLKDFKSGGWIAWNEMVLKPQNNIYGAYVMAWDQYEIEKSAAAKAAEAEAQAGRGFLGVKKCIEWDSSQAITACSEVYTDCKAQGTSSEECSQLEKQCYNQNQICKKYETVTPGSVVGDMASKAVGSDIDWLVNAQDFKAYVAAITNAILNRVFAEGVGLLHTAISNNNSGGSGGSTAQAQCAQLLGTAAYNDCVTAIQTGQDMREFQKNNLISMIDNDLKYRNQLLAAKQVTLNTLNQSLTALQELQTCQGNEPPELITVQSAASSTTQQVFQIQSDIISLQNKQQEVMATTDLTKIPSLFSQISAIVKPAQTYNLVLAAQDETVQKQQNLSSYQGQLASCVKNNQ